MNSNATNRLLWMSPDTMQQGRNQGKDQESIQSSTSPDPGHHIRKASRSALSEKGDHKTVCIRNRQDSVKKVKHETQK